MKVPKLDDQVTKDFVEFFGYKTLDDMRGRILEKKVFDPEKFNKTSIQQDLRKVLYVSHHPKIKQPVKTENDLMIIFRTFIRYFDFDLKYMKINNNKTEFSGYVVIKY